MGVRYGSMEGFFPPSFRNAMVVGKDTVGRGSSAATNGYRVESSVTHH